jgi:hypothetical protein
MERNEGIVVSGGSFSAGAVAAGRGATAVQQEGGEASRLAAELRELLAGHEAARADADAVVAELATPSPAHGRLRELLDGIAGAAGGLTGVATAVAALRAAIGI